MEVHLVLGSRLREEPPRRTSTASARFKLRARARRSPWRARRRRIEHVTEGCAEDQRPRASCGRPRARRPRPRLRPGPQRPARRDHALEGRAGGDAVVRLAGRAGDCRHAQHRGSGRRRDGRRQPASAGRAEQSGAARRAPPRPAPLHDEARPHAARPRPARGRAVAGGPGRRRNRVPSARGRFRRSGRRRGLQARPSRCQRHFRPACGRARRRGVGPSRSSPLLIAPARHRTLTSMTASHSPAARIQDTTAHSSPTCSSSRVRVKHALPSIPGRVPRCRASPGPERSQRHCSAAAQLPARHRAACTRTACAGGPRS